MIKRLPGLSLFVRVALAATLTFVLSHPLSAATFEPHCSTGIEQAGGCSILMRGKIERGDRERLLQALSTPLNAPGFFRTLVLDSPGGDVQEAFMLSEVVVRAALNTSTYALGNPDFASSKTMCVSACFLVWVAGAERDQGSFGFLAGKKNHGIGLHRPFFAAEAYAQLDASTAAQRQQELFTKVRAYLRRYDVPDAMIDEMMNRSSREIYWLSSLDDPFALSGRAPWFEELMIARCRFDPVYDREAQAESVKELNSNIKTSPSRKKYIEWRRTYNACEYAFRKASQQRLLTSK